MGGPAHRAAGERNCFPSAWLPKKESELRNLRSQDVRVALGFSCSVSCYSVYFRCEEGRIGRIVGLALHCHLEATFGMASASLLWWAMLRLYCETWISARDADDDRLKACGKFGPAWPEKQCNKRCCHPPGQYIRLKHWVP